MKHRTIYDYLNKISTLGSRPGLEAVGELLKRLGNPQMQLKVVHIAGTNGKGSTHAFLKRMLYEAGYCVGCFCSPAVFKPEEIIQIDYIPIGKDEMLTYTEQMKNLCDAMVADGFSQPTVFEIQTAIAITYFKDKCCDICLIECGMGGRFDATNVFEKVLCSVITSISLDHVNFLGNTLPEITQMKAGIIKKGCPVISAWQRDEVYDVLKRVAKEQNAPLYCANVAKYSGVEDQFQEPFYESTASYRSSAGVHYLFVMHMAGTFQLKNVATAIETAEILAAQGFQIKNYICTGIKNAVWPGRLEMICQDPLMILDGAHNPDAVRELGKTIDLHFSDKKIDFIMGMLEDKNVEECVTLIVDKAQKIYTVTPPNERALHGERLAQKISPRNRHVQFEGHIGQALKQARNDIFEGKADMILAFGSLTYLRELKSEYELIRRRENNEKFRDK